MAAIHESDRAPLDTKNPDAFGTERLPPPTNTLVAFMFKVPWWAVSLVIIAAFVYVAILSDDIYNNIFRQLRNGLSVTLRVSFFAYSGALVIGLIVGVIRSTTPAPQSGLRRGTLSVLHLLIHNLATFFVEVVRGLPILIVLLMAAFVGLPEIRNVLSDSFGIELNLRGNSVELAMIALAIAYGAFLSEVFRSGIQSIEKGQIEAAKSLGMTTLQTLRFIVLPQAIRRVIPPLGNDFIAMIKDSSLVAILGIRDVTQTAKVTSGSNFRYVETYLTVAVLYLSLTILGSIVVRIIEKRLKGELKLRDMQTFYNRIVRRTSASE